MAPTGAAGDLTYSNLEDTVPVRFPMTRGLEYEPLASVSGTHQRLRTAQDVCALTTGFVTRLLHAGIIRLPMLEGSDIAISDCCCFCGVYECSYLSFWQLFYLIYRHSPLVLLWYVARDF